MPSDHTLQLLGKIVRFQVQPDSLISGARPSRVYSPASLLSVEELTLTPHGALARLPEGATLLDVHHAHHPQTKNEADENALSVNFTPHYAAIRAEFGGEHLFDGCAGENILVETDRQAGWGELARGIAIQPASGGPLVRLRMTQAAHPCRPFSGYVLGGTEASVKEALQFLDDGIRGFYCTLAQEQPMTVAVGDQVFVLSA